jgi:tetratricopeptide (TPR) repeat protein
MRPMARAFGLAVAALCAAGAFGSSASAQTPDRARLHFEAGASYYEAGDYEDALREFRRSFELSQEPQLYYNFSLCHQQLGQYEQAAEDLQRYLDRVTDVENRVNLERRLSNLRERASEGDGAEDRADEDPPEEEDEGLVLSPIAIAGFATAGAGALMVGIFGGLALAERSDLDGDPCSVTRTCDASGLRTKAVLADIGLGLLVAGAALGTVFLFLGGDEDDDGDEAQARWTVAPSVSREGAALSARGVF